ncbi:TPA: site-specific DNA-methyltransferase [Pseudomonas aeruginosa]|nr:site-specific DNA-methyltransferase [Pseudomonas aeruginosa]
MDKLKMHSPNLTEMNIEKLAQLFPGCVTEATDGKGGLKKSIDFDLLRQELSEQIVEGPQERYQLSWPGKREALLAANAPIAKALHPCRKESVDFDATQNLFIEGDNLEALKLLQEAYLGKIKLIYIDPPYNTGSDFIYDDDFSEDANDYLVRSNQKNNEGIRLVLNGESNGRFHSDWLSMIYPRLKLARNLLSEDGVIFVSIDDSESANLKRILDEVFGEQNFIDTIAVELSTTSGPKTVNAQQGTIVKNVEFIHIYRKSEEFDKVSHKPLLDGVDSYDTHYSVWLSDDGSLGTLAEMLLSDNVVGAEIRRYGLLERGKFSINNLDKLLSVSEAAKTFIDSNLQRIARVDRAPVSAAGRSTPVGRWEPFEVDHRTYLLTTLGNGNLQSLMPLSLNYRMSDDYKPRFGRTVIRGDLWKGFHQDMGNVAKEGGMVFSNGKKPVRLIKQLIRWANNNRNGIILDFFAGSGTTAHAVLQANAEDGGNRRFIMVQLDEVPDPKSEAAKAGYKSIAEISRQRIRQAGATIAEDAGCVGKGVDVGFRALKIGSSNMKDVYYTPDAVNQDLLSGQIDCVREDCTPEDLLFQVLLDWGVDLALPISQEAIADKKVFFVDGNALVACFDKGIDETFVKQIAEHKPLRVVFRDNGFASDSVKINVEQLFKLLSPMTEIKTL